MRDAASKSAGETTGALRGTGGGCPADSAPTTSAASMREITLDTREPEVIVRLTMTFDRAADDFLGDCERRGFTRTTIASYARTYDEFADRIPQDTDVSKITTDDIRRYLNTKNKLSRGTRHNIECHLAALFAWLLLQGKITRDPFIPITRTKQLPSEDLDVVMVSTEEVRRMLAAATGWTERLCMGVLVYTGCRRHAAATLKFSDYDQLHGRLRFREKGGKTIWKPVPDELASLIQAAMAAGVYSDNEYLIPNRGPRPVGKGERNDRIIWRTVKDVAARAGVKAHTHSLRAAFACFCLESDMDLLSVQELLGHRSLNTTKVYLRKLDKERHMEPVRGMTWGVAVGANSESAESMQFAGNQFDDNALMGAGGFEPPYLEHPVADRAGTEHMPVLLLEEDE